MRNEKKKSFPFGKFGKSFWINSVLVVFLWMMFCSSAHAGGLEGSKLVTGTKSLLQDAGKVLVVLGIIAGGVFMSYYGIRMAGADEQDKKGWKNRIMAAAIGTIIAVAAGAIITMLVKYYQ